MHREGAQGNVQTLGKFLSDYSQHLSSWKCSRTGDAMCLSVGNVPKIAKHLTYISLYIL